MHLDFFGVRFPDLECLLKYLPSFIDITQKDSTQLLYLKDSWRTFSEFITWLSAVTAKAKNPQFLRETAHIEFYEFNHINKNLICLNQIAKTSYFILV